MVNTSHNFDSTYFFFFCSSLVKEVKNRATPNDLLNTKFIKGTTITKEEITDWAQSHL